MSLSLTPSKRSHDGNQESNGNKLQKQSMNTSSGSAVFRLLCPTSKIDKITGKDGAVISQIREETGVEVRIEEAFPECDERVISIMEAHKEAETNNEVHIKDGESPNVVQEQKVKMTHVENDKDKPSPSVENLGSEKGLLKALLLVFEKLSEEDEDLGNENKESRESINFTLRLLSLSSQVGCILGKDGSLIKQMSNESEAQIEVLPRDKLPSCVSSLDEVIQITGISDAIKKAIKLISVQIIENASRDLDPTSASTQSSGNHSSRSEAHTKHRLSSQGVPRNAKFRESFGPNKMDMRDSLSIRLLCPAERVGGLIGKGGAVIKGFKHETGCEIIVIEDVPDGEDRIVVITGYVHPGDRISGVQDAALRVQAQISKLAPDSNDKTVVTKILVSSNQIGCLLGKGGAVISEMRKVTGAYIRVLGKDQNPQCASENEEVVQINGELEVVQEALLQITTRLKHHYFRENHPSLNLGFDPMFPSPAHPPSFMGRRELPSPGMFHGPSFHRFDSINGPHTDFHPHDDRSPFMHDMNRPGIPHRSERPWGPQRLLEGGPMGSDFAGGPPMRMAGFGGGIHPAIITNTKMEVVVPSKVVPIIYGEDGGCLKQIRQISDAKITITDPKPGATETMIIISGNPEQTHAAQSLIQAFVISETETSLCSGNVLLLKP